MTERLVMPYQVLISMSADVAWYDMIEVENPPEKLAALSADLKSGEILADCGVDDIPADVWAAHRAQYKAGGTGLNLEDMPSIVGVLRNEHGNVGFLIGYKAAA